MGATVCRMLGVTVCNFVLLAESEAQLKTKIRKWKQCLEEKWLEGNIGKSKG